MRSPYHQIALECRPLRIDGVEAASQSPSLAMLRLGLTMLFVGLMLTLSVTLSLAATSNREASAARAAAPERHPEPITTVVAHP